MKNPIVIEVIHNRLSKLDEDLKIENARDHTNDFEYKELNKWTSHSQRLKILEQFYISKKSRSVIANDLWIPYPTVWRVIRNGWKLPQTIASLFQPKPVNLLKWERVQKKVVEYIKSQSGVFNSRDVQKYIKTTTGVNVNQQSIIVFMKSILGMTYKRVSSRPVMKIPYSIILKKVLFWLEYAHMIKQEHVIVNIDETLFSKSTKINYSWSSKRRDNIVNNISF